MPDTNQAGSGLPLSPTKVTVREFRSRIGFFTLVGIEMELEGVDPERALIRAQLRVLKDSLNTVQHQEVDLTHPEVIAGIGILVQLGLKTQEEAAAILTLPSL